MLSLLGTGFAKWRSACSPTNLPVVALARAALTNAPDDLGGSVGRTTRCWRIYLAKPRLRGALALNLSVAAAGAMVIVDTVVLECAGFGLARVRWTERRC